MNVQDLEAVSALADKLGQSAETLIGFYVVRAPMEFVDVGLLWFFTICGGTGVWLAYKWNKRTEAEGEEILTIVVGAVCALGAVITLGVGAEQLSIALKAVVSPEAYAIDQILRAASGS